MSARNGFVAPIPISFRSRSGITTRKADASETNAQARRFARGHAELIGRATPKRGPRGQPARRSRRSAVTIVDGRGADLTGVSRSRVGVNEYGGQGPVGTTATPSACEAIGAIRV